MEAAAEAGSKTDPATDILAGAHRSVVGSLVGETAADGLAAMNKASANGDHPISVVAQGAMASLKSCAYQDCLNDAEKSKSLAGIFFGGIFCSFLKPQEKK